MTFQEERNNSLKNNLKILDEIIEQNVKIKLRAIEDQFREEERYKYKYYSIKEKIHGSLDD